jgi:hypothetical protein
MPLMPGDVNSIGGITADDWANILKKRGAVGRTGGATSTVPYAAPAFAPVAAPGQVTVSQGYMPDYRNLILSDPAYLAYQANAGRSISDASAARQHALRALAIQYGGLPSDFADQYGDIDQQTRDLAGANQFSDTANLQRNYEQGIETFKKQLAARNMLSSGELPYGLEQAEFNKGQQQYVLGNQFGAAAGQVVSNFTGAVDQQSRDQIAALGIAGQNVFSNPANRPTEAMSADLDQALTTQHGVPVYKALDGSLWTLGPDGAPIPFGGGGPAPAPSAPSNVGTLSPEQIANNPGTNATQSYVDPGFYTWSGTPDQAYVVNQDGSITFKSGATMV